MIKLFDPIKAFTDIGKMLDNKREEQPKETVMAFNYKVTRGEQISAKRWYWHVRDAGGSIEKTFKSRDQARAYANTLKRQPKEQAA